MYDSLKLLLKAANNDVKNKVKCPIIIKSNIKTASKFNLDTF